MDLPFAINTKIRPFDRVQISLYYRDVVSDGERQAEVLQTYLPFLSIAID